MTAWVPIAVFPNLSGGDVIEGDFVAIAPFSDARVQLICRVLPLFGDFASRFTDAFGVGLEPSVLIARTDYYARLTQDALLSFREIAAISIITISRALNTVYNLMNPLIS